MKIIIAYILSSFLLMAIIAIAMISLLSGCANQSENNLWKELKYTETH